MKPLHPNHWTIREAPGLFVFLLLSCMNCLYILKVKLLSVALFAHVFSHSVGCLFVLFMVSFAVQKLVSWIRSHLFIFVFISIALGDWPEKTLVWFMSENVLPVISSRSFMVSCLTFKPLSHFEFVFVCGESVLTSSVYTWLSHFPNITCWRDCLFPIVLRQNNIALYVYTAFCLSSHLLMGIWFVSPFSYCE